MQSFPSILFVQITNTTYVIDQHEWIGKWLLSDDVHNQYQQSSSKTKTTCYSHRQKRRKTKERVSYWELIYLAIRFSNIVVDFTSAVLTVMLQFPYTKGGRKNRSWTIYCWINSCPLQKVCNRSIPIYPEDGRSSNASASDDFLSPWPKQLAPSERKLLKNCKSCFNLKN